MASQEKVQDVTQTKDEIRKRQTVETGEVEQELVSAEQADLAALQRTVANPGGISAGDVPALQRMVGNRAAAQLLAGQSPRVQAKLVVGPAGDKYEREADQMAKQVVNTVPSSSQSPPVQRDMFDLNIPDLNIPTINIPSLPIPTINIPSPPAPIINITSIADEIQNLTQTIISQMEGPSAGPMPEADVQVVRDDEPGLPGVEGTWTTMWMKREPATADSLQRLTGWGTVADEEGLLEDHSFEVSVNLETRLKELAGRGNSLPEKLQEEMENAFKADFSQVVIHADSAADELCQALSAQAFAQSYDIYFAQDKYKPWSVDGKELIAHELTHVVQQMGYGQQTDQPDSDSAE